MQLEIAPDITIDVPAASFSERAAAAWAWPDPMRPSEWAQQHRELQEKDAHAAGPWENARAPYLRGIMDLAAAPGVERIVVEKAAQIGVSEATRNLIGYWAHHDPAPMGLALPDKIRGEQIVSDRLMPLFQQTSVLRALLTSRAHDVKKQQITLANAFTIFLMWSGSPAAMAANPMKRVITDEANKHTPWRGGTVDPIDSGDKRLRTYPDSLHFIPSTPTSRHGRVSREFDACPTHLYFLVACPHCGARQRLVFPQLIIPPAEDGESNEQHAERLVRHNLCTYRCAVCEAEITEKERRRIVADGRWGTVGEDQMLADGRIEDAEAIDRWPDGTRLGMQIGAFYCLWESVSLATIAAEFQRAAGDPAALYTFRTETCGERWEHQSADTKPGTFRVKAQRATLGEGILPWWTDRVLITVDTQKDHFWVVVRAWGSGMLSHRVWHGRAESFAELEQLMRHPWPYDGQWLPARTAYLVLIDSGGTAPGEDDRATRTQEVYAWSLQHNARVRPIKGANKPRESRELYWAGRGVFRDQQDTGKQREREVRLWMLDVNQCQDILAEMIEAEVEIVQPDSGEAQTVEQWTLSARSDAEYDRHMANLHRVVEKEGSELVERWVPIQAGARVDYRDAEGYQIAAAYMAGIHRLPDLPRWRERIQQQVQELQSPRVQGGVRTPDGRPYLVTQR